MERDRRDSLDSRDSLIPKGTLNMVIDLIDAALAARPEPELREAAQAAYDVLARLGHQAADGGGPRGQVYVTVETWRLVIAPVIEQLGAALRSTKPG